MTNKKEKSLIIEWSRFASILLKPLIFLPILIALIAIYYSTFSIDDDMVSFIVNVFSILLAGIASAYYYDILKSMIGATILQKKGGSAIRSLSLTKNIINNISARISNGASMEEVKNLLNILEKKTVNSIQEWNDIIPGLEGIEAIYLILEEKEREAINLTFEIENQKQRIEEEGALDHGKKDFLKKELEKKEATITKLKEQISELNLLKSTTLFPGYEVSAKLKDILFKNCKVCDRLYLLTLDDKGQGLCPDCRSLEGELNQENKE